MCLPSKQMHKELYDQSQLPNSCRERTAIKNFILRTNESKFERDLFILVDGRFCISLSVYYFRNNTPTPSAVKAAEHVARNMRIWDFLQISKNPAKFSEMTRGLITGVGEGRLLKLFLIYGIFFV